MDQLNASFTLYSGSVCNLLTSHVFEAIKCGSKDNLSCMVVLLGGGEAGGSEVHNLCSRSCNLASLLGKAKGISECWKRKEQMERDRSGPMFSFLNILGTNSLSLSPSTSGCLVVPSPPTSFYLQAPCLLAHLLMAYPALQPEKAHMLHNLTTSVF